MVKCCAFQWKFQWICLMTSANRTIKQTPSIFLRQVTPASSSRQLHGSFSKFRTADHFWPGLASLQGMVILTCLTATAIPQKSMSHRDVDRNGQRCRCQSFPRSLSQLESSIVVPRHGHVRSREIRFHLLQFSLEHNKTTLFLAGFSVLNKIHLNFVDLPWILLPCSSQPIGLTWPFFPSRLLTLRSSTAWRWHGVTGSGGWCHNFGTKIDDVLIFCISDFFTLWQKWPKSPRFLAFGFGHIGLGPCPLRFLIVLAQCCMLWPFAFGAWPGTCWKCVLVVAKFPTGYWAGRSILTCWF